MSAEDVFVVYQVPGGGKAGGHFGYTPNEALAEAVADSRRAFLEENPELPSPNHVFVSEISQLSWSDVDGLRECPKCEGEGTIENYQRSRTEPCSACNGDGYVDGVELGKNPDDSNGGQS